jgi:hypothetical protein
MQCVMYHTLGQDGKCANSQKSLSKPRFRPRDLSQRPRLQIFPKVLPNGILRDEVDKHHAATELLIVRGALLHVAHDILLRELGAVGHYDVRPRQVGAGVLGRGDADDSGFVHAGVCDQQVLELRWGDLEAFELEQLLSCGLISAQVLN